MTYNFQRMAQLRLFALFFVALCGAERAVGAPPTVVEAPDELIKVINLARRWKLPVMGNELVKNEDLTHISAEAIRSQIGDGCVNKWNLKVEEIGGPIIYHGPTIEKSDFHNIIQEVLDRGLGGMPEYPQEGWAPAEEPWVNEPVANLIHFLCSTSTQVGCAYTTDCPRVQLLVCIMQPRPQLGEHPFSKEYYDAVRARSATLYQSKSPKKRVGDSPAAGNAKDTPGASFLLVGLAAVLTMVAT